MTWRAAVPRSRGTRYRPAIGPMPCLRQNKALIDQRGAEGPDALQVSIKVPIALHDLEGCGPSQPRNPIKAQHWAHALFAAKQSSHRSARRRGTGRPPGPDLSIKVPIALHDLKGCGPSQPRNPINTRHWAHALLPQNKALIDQRGA